MQPLSPKERKHILNTRPNVSEADLDRYELLISQHYLDSNCGRERLNLSPELMQLIKKVFLPNGRRPISRLERWLLASIILAFIASVALVLMLVSFN